LFKKTETTIDELLKTQKEMEKNNLKNSRLISSAEFTDKFLDKREAERWSSDVGDLEWMDPNLSWSEKIGVGFYSIRNSTHRLLGTAINNLGNNALAIAATSVGGLAGTDAAYSTYYYLQDNIGPIDFASNLPGINILAETESIDENRKRAEDLDPNSEIARSQVFGALQTTSKHALGGLKTPENPKVKPLDLEAARFIRSKIDNMEISNKMDKSKEKKEEVSNITIIENYIAKQESYETYTLSQLSRGLLAGG
jgi:hypothetical protein